MKIVFQKIIKIMLIISLISISNVSYAVTQAEINKQKSEQSTIQSQLNQLEKKTLDMDVPSFKQYNSKLMIALEVISMLQLARLIVKSALLRKESRGAHFRSDYPESKDEWKRSIVLNKNKIKFEAR